MPRVRGYHYVRGRDGRKHRVYGSKSGRSYGTSRRRGTTTAFGRVYGKGAYYARRRRPQSGRQMANTPSTGSRRRGGGIALVFNGTDPPKMSMGRNGVVVEHREYIQDITSSVPFIPENFPLNPGLQQTFPWLSQIADNFEEWVPEGILFEYKTTSSNTVVNTTNSNPGLGTVIIATQYNSLNNQFGNKQQMENYQDAVSVDPSRSVIHPIECAKPQTPVQPMYVRTGNLDQTKGPNDLRFYDLGVTTVATVGQQTNNFVIGELWITYRIRFLKPRLQTGVGNNEQGNVDHFTFIWQTAGGTYYPGVAGILPATPFGTQQLLLPPTEGSTLGGVISGGVTMVNFDPANPNDASQQSVNFPPSLGGARPFPIFAIAGGQVQPVQVPSAVNTYYFPPGITSGVYLCQYSARYTTGGASPAQIVTALQQTNNCELWNLFNNGLTSEQTNNTASTTQNDIATFYIRVLGNYANFSMAGTSGAFATPLNVDFIVVQLPPGMWRFLTGP